MNNTPFPEQDGNLLPQEDLDLLNALDGFSEEPQTEPAPAEPAPEEPAPVEPEIQEHPKLTAPEVQEPITADEDAYGFHGMTDPGKPNDGDLDLSILDEPAAPRELLPGDTIDLDSPAPAAPVYEAPEEQPFQETLEEEIPQDEEAADEAGSEEEAAPPPRKGRPKHKKGEGLFGIPNILVTGVWLALTVLIGVTLGRMLWISAADVLAFGQEDRPVTITIYESDDIDAITEKLYNAKLIRYPGLFKLYAKFAVDEGEIHPGIWDLNAKYDYHALVRMMAPSSSREVVTVLIPEGYTCRQIFAALEENKVCTVQAISEYAANGELDEYLFLEGLERGDKYCLEGFLFPDTYEFYKNDSPRNVLQKMLNNFQSKLDEEMAWQLDQLNGHLTDVMRANGKNDDYIAKHTLTLRDVITVASMVEKETANAEEGHTIASVIYNRLYDWGSTPAYLNIDASIIYALDGKTTELTTEDLKVDSPYNTYTHTGLTPGPISNPGLSSIKAALQPATTDYYFYVLDPTTGVHHFSRTQEEHDAFRASLAAQ